jgi:hypothetical protein
MISKDGDGCSILKECNSATENPKKRELKRDFQVVGKKTV